MARAFEQAVEAARRIDPEVGAERCAFEYRATDMGTLWASSLWDVGGPGCFDLADEHAGSPESLEGLAPARGSFPAGTRGVRTQIEDIERTRAERMSAPWIRHEFLVHGLQDREEEVPVRFEHASELDKPVIVRLDTGIYYWCRCGKTATPPYCDGPHEGTDITPLEFEMDGETPIPLCTCGLTSRPPQCDGSHIIYDGLHGEPESPEPG